MLTFTTQTAGFLQNSVRIFVVAGIICLANTSASDAFQSAGVPQSPKTAAIANLKFEMKSVIDSMETIKQNARNVQGKISELINRRETIYQEQDALGVSRESFSDVLKNLQGRRVELMIDLAGIDARRDSLTEIQETEISSKSDSSTVELLTKIVELCEKKRDEAKHLHENGAVSSTEVNAAEIEYLSAKLKLRNARNPVLDSPRINEELLSVSLDRAEKRARLVKTEEILKTMIESQSYSRG